MLPPLSLWYRVTHKYWNLTRCWTWNLFSPSVRMQNIFIHEPFLEDSWVVSGSIRVLAFLYLSLSVHVCVSLSFSVCVTWLLLGGPYTVMLAWWAAGTSFIQSFLSGVGLCSFLRWFQVRGREQTAVATNGGLDGPAAGGDISLRPLDYRKQKACCNANKPKQVHVDFIQRWKD